MPDLIVTLSLYSLQLLYISGLFAFRPLSDIELHFLAFLQRLKTITLNNAVMHKHILAVIRSDEAVSFSVIEPFHFSFYHCLLPPSVRTNSK